MAEVLIPKNGAEHIKSYREDLDRRIILTTARLAVFIAYPNPVKLSETKEYYLKYQESFFPPTQYQVAVSLDQRNGKQPKTREEYVNDWALYVYQRDIDVAKSFASGEGVNGKINDTLDDLTYQEAEKLARLLGEKGEINDRLNGVLTAAFPASSDR